MAEQSLDKFNGQELAHTAWVFATVGYQHEHWQRWRSRVWTSSAGRSSPTQHGSSQQSVNSMSIGKDGGAESGQVQWAGARGNGSLQQWLNSMSIGKDGRAWTSSMGRSSPTQHGSAQ